MPPLNTQHDGDSLMLNGKALLTYQCSSPTPAQWYSSIDNGDDGILRPSRLTNCLRFELQLQPHETRTMDFVVAGTSSLYPPGERKTMARVKFDDALRRAARQWDRALEPGMTFEVPEPKLNSAYRQLVLSSLQHLVRSPDQPWCEPWQAAWYNQVFFPWEAAHMLISLESCGYYRECEPALKYYVQSQYGIGSLKQDWRPPGFVGKVNSVGAYSGRSAGWLNDTGCVLWSMASYCRYSRDNAWLATNRASILAACDFIRRARAQTRVFKKNGEKAEYYGLLPPGRLHDIGGDLYGFGMSDNYTWKGMSEMAKAFSKAGMPEARLLASDADDYKQCILDVIQRAQFSDPETGLPFIPNIVFYRERGANPATWPSDGAPALFATGLLDSVSDPRCEPTLEVWKHKIGFTMGLGYPYEGRMYATAPERGLFQNYLARNEIEKALLVFYSTLAYSMSQDTYQTVERMDLFDGSYTPVQPNASANGRCIEMMRRIVIDEQDEARGTLWLLRGCPRRWFAPGKSISVSDAPTVFGKAALRAACTDRAITIDIDPPADPAMKRLCVALRHPARQKPRKVTINGASTTIKDEIVTVNAPTGHLQIVAEYD